MVDVANVMTKALKYTDYTDRNMRNWIYVEVVTCRGARSSRTGIQMAAAFRSGHIRGYFINSHRTICDLSARVFNRITQHYPEEIRGDLWIRGDLNNQAIL